ncbi:hypothetical protein BC830DRAFT_271249 [Chytriomyces sp. MP71]|nr:hypothetical protein BC830DRAFT_271249 [Chytriomyces sp. MP71]
MARKEAQSAYQSEYSNRPRKGHLHPFLLAYGPNAFQNGEEHLLPSHKKVTSRFIKAQDAQCTRSDSQPIPATPRTVHLHPIQPLVRAGHSRCQTRHIVPRTLVFLPTKHAQIVRRTWIAQPTWPKARRGGHAHTAEAAATRARVSAARNAVGAVRVQEKVRVRETRRAIRTASPREGLD